MYYYFDGDFPEYEIKTPKEYSFSSAYSVKLSSNYNQIEINGDRLDRIKDKAYHEVVDFYNRNEQFFQDLKKVHGLNVWFLEHFRLYFTYKNFLCKLEAIESFLQTHPNGIVLSSDERLKSYIEGGSLKVLPIKKKNTGLVSNRFFKEVLFILSQLRLSKEKKKSDILLMPKSVGNNVEVDFRFGELGKLCDVSVTRELFYLKQPLAKGNKLNRERYNSDQILLKHLLSLKWLKQLRVFNRSLNTLKEELRSNNKRKVDQFIISAYFSNKMSLMLYELRFCSYKQYFNNNTIKAIVLSDENSPQQKVIQYAAKLNGVKVYALQHGAIYYLHMAYTFGCYNNKPLLPDITFLWGKHYEKVLLEVGGYTKSQLSVVGRITPLNENRVNRIGYNGNKKIVLFASQPQPDENLRKLYIKDVMIAHKKNESTYQLIIRPHPAEKNDSYFEEIGESVDFNDFIIDRESDLKTHFEECSILITAYSTVGAEFIPYSKPLLVLDYLNQDIASYIKEGVGIQIENGEELSEMLLNESISYNKQAYTEFIKNFFYTNDQLAANRIINIINEAI